MNATITCNVVDFDSEDGVGSETVTLTTEHAASSSGQPIMILDGKAYGPGDSIGDARYRDAASYIRHLLLNIGASVDDPDGLVDRFLR